MKKDQFTVPVALSFMDKAGITEEQVIVAGATISGNSRISFIAVTEVPVSATAKKAGIVIEKVSLTFAALYSGMKPETNPYLNRMIKRGIVDHELKQNWFKHYCGVYSLVEKKSDTNEKYLYCLPDDGKSFYFVNGNHVDKSEVYQYLTPSEVKKMTGEKTAPVECRVFKIANVKKIACLGDLIEG